MPFSIGDRAPVVLGATASGRFFSLDAQAGRPVVVASLGELQPEAAARLLDRLRASAPLFQAAGVDVAPLAPASPAFIGRFATDPAARDDLLYVTTGNGVELAHVDGVAAGVLIDRSGRVVDIIALDETTDIAAWLNGCARRIWAEPAQIRASTAPALMIPNIASPELCRALIDHFEGSVHEAGVMASFKDGGAYAKLDEDKKKRRDTELTPDMPLHAEVVDLLAKRVIPEIKRAFQVDMAFADRILIARYDDTGGYFKRHRDNAAPHTAFREFAISLNLNTHEYEGGELMFPEYDDHRYNPPAGGAVIFSASLLHEAAPVTKGSRYVLLSFLGSAAAQAKLDAWTESQKAIAS
ncbi:2OG-Fe(II) oxygenase [Phenylobacterium sp.]|uniref:2OG-Fe(II) oxygenase n=1 Tax=Phenylobacterium sp. TaxID=1871053 RepID=UPI002E339334|nr:2OG-Fe(II) oxygenase [Phenylobacterium sp.]HEX3365252.1 2OG-Fe(II) oxygenase [Phenylobacterium sp.]